MSESFATQPPQRNEKVVDPKTGVATLRFLEYLESVDSQITLNTAEETAEQAAGNVMSLLQGVIFDLVQNPRLPSFTLSEAQGRVLGNGSMIMVSDESSGNVPAYSDGTNWRRFSDDGVIS